MKPCLAWIGCAIIASMAPAASAQEIQWRTDYVAAREEAKQRNLPLFLDIGTANCTWCRKLDSSTFRDPEVAKALNNHFIPVKIDADRDRRVDAWGVRSYPTLMFAGPDGKILDRKNGYVDAGELLGVLASSRKAVKQVETAEEDTIIRCRVEYTK